MKTAPLAALLALACPAVALAQSPAVEFRVVERHASPIGTVTGASSSVLNYAVQARVTGAPNVGLSQCSFNIVLAGEAPANGALALNTINNSDGSYWAGAIDSTSISANKVAGTAYAFRYLIGISPSFNGLINSSGGTWTNDPGTASIGLVTLSSAGTNYLLYTDPTGTGHPDSPLDALTELNPWFGANGNWIDLYRFQYTVTNLSTNRVVTVRLDLDTTTVHVFSTSTVNSGLWSPASVLPGTISATGASFTVDALGACCDNLSAACSMASPSQCTGGTFRGAGTVCSPSPCPGGACCSPATGGCAFATALGCGSPQAFLGLGTICSPNPCPQPGTCCAADGGCTFVLHAACASPSWTQGGACSPNPCPQPGVCCPTSGACAIILQSACTGAGVWTQTGVCSPNPCPQPTVEFRVVERHPTPLTTVVAGSNVLNFAVQARVTGVPNAGMSDAGFHIEMPGEPEANGAIALNTINNADGSYFTGPINSTSGAGGAVTGAAYAYRYLIGLNPQFGGLINMSGGSWTNNTSQQDIGLVTLFSANTNYLAYTDPGNTGQPQSPLDPATQLNPWFGANGNWIDIYRFQYTVSNVTQDRTVAVNLVLDSSVRVFSTSQLANGLWSPAFVPAVNTPVQSAAFRVAYLGACCSPQTGQCTSTAPGSCNGTFQGSGTVCTPLLCPSGACCTPSSGACAITGPQGCSSPLIFRGISSTCGATTCPTGSCCAVTGVCSTTMAAGCTDPWTAGQACAPSNPCPQPGRCCSSTGACTFVLQSGCGTPTTWTQGVSCTPNTCPPPGSCCSTSGACTFVLQAACPQQALQWSANTPCVPNTCPQPGACCDAAGGCTFVVPPLCTASFRAGACVPNPCPQPGVCCASAGTCSFILQSSCASGDWRPAGACAPNPCPQPGSCCVATGACTSTFQVPCAGLWTIGGVCSPNTCAQPHTTVVRTVRAAGPGPAAPWNAAFTTVQAALAVSQANDEVWIAAGTYTPPTTAGFAIPRGVRIYGGFAGTETAISQRSADTTANQAVLSGPAEHILVGNATDASTVLDRLTVRAGGGMTLVPVAPNFTDPDPARAVGGGLSITNGSLYVSDCRFEANHSSRRVAGFASSTDGGAGGAVYVAAATAQFVRCSFTSNATSTGWDVGCTSGVGHNGGSGGPGGAVAFYSSTVKFTECSFVGNATAQGLGGDSCSQHLGSGGNGGNGGAVYGADSTSTFARCTFSSNAAGPGGYGGAWGGGSCGVGGCSTNGVGGSGGAAAFSGGSSQFTGCLLTGNLAGAGGSQVGQSLPQGPGGLGGGAGGNGAALWSSASTVAMIDCLVAGNTAGAGGAGSFVFVASNGGTAGTGAIDLQGGSLSLIASTLAANAPGQPGAPSSGGGSPGAPGIGGVVSDTPVTISNSILYNNTNGQLSSPTPTITFSDIQGGSSGGSGNIAADPLFVNAGAGDFRLSPSSPCIDAGSNALVSDTLGADAGGNSRFVAGCGVQSDTATPTVDIGVYEFQGAPPGADCNADGVCDLRQVTGAQVLRDPGGVNGAMNSDRFGWWVITDGTTAMVGARSTDTALGAGSGVAYFYTRQGSVWGDRQAVRPLDAATGDDFGNMVAVSGQRAAVSARFATVNGQLGMGAVYAYANTVSGWQQVGKITPPDGHAGDEFGHGLVVENDRMVVGALTGDSPTVADCGAVYVYQHNGAGWALDAKLTPADPTMGKGFGLSTAVSGDTIVVGAPYDGNGGNQAGSFYIFQKFGSAWVQLAKVLPPAGIDHNGSNFGEFVVISGDRLIANAPRLSHSGRFQAGAAYVYRRSGSSWILEERLTSDAPLDGEWFGFGLCMDNDRALVGGFRRTVAGSFGSGAAYYFRRFGTSWLMASRIDDPDPTDSAYFGYSVAFAGERALVSAHKWGFLAPSITGVVRPFDLTLLDGSHDGVPDACQIASGALRDNDHNGIPDSVQFNPCRADFNSFGGVNVQDVFDYLTAWFSGDPRADINGAAGLTVQDIFDFLSAWFQGC